MPHEPSNIPEGLLVSVEDKDHPSLCSFLPFRLVYNVEEYQHAPEWAAMREEIANIPIPPDIRQKAAEVAENTFLNGFLKAYQGFEDNELDDVWKTQGTIRHATVSDMQRHPTLATIKAAHEAEFANGINGKKHHLEQVTQEIFYAVCQFKMLEEQCYKLYTEGALDIKMPWLAKQVNELRESDQFEAAMDRVEHGMSREA